MTNLPDLKGHVALVTGADGHRPRRGRRARPGRRNRGSRGPSAGPLADVVREIRAAGGGAAAYPTDLTSLDAAGELVTRAARELGAIDILVNNARMIAPLGPTESLDAAEIEASYRLNALLDPNHRPTPGAAPRHGRIGITRSATGNSSKRAGAITRATATA